MLSDESAFINPHSLCSSFLNSSVLFQLAYHDLGNIVDTLIECGFDESQLDYLIMLEVKPTHRPRNAPRRFMSVLACRLGAHPCLSLQLTRLHVVRLNENSA